MKSEVEAETPARSTSLAKPMVFGMLSLLREEAIAESDKAFLQEHAKHLQKAMEKSFIWRTDAQKRSIICDDYHPTLHGKFHQAILEQKVMFEQTIELAKQFELARLDAEEALVDLEEAMRAAADEELPKYARAKAAIAAKRCEITHQERVWALQGMQIQMNYRMKEVRGWQELIDDLVIAMRTVEGKTEEQIWDKQAGDVEEMFFLFLSNLKGAYTTKDAGEKINLVALARFGVEQAKRAEFYDRLLLRCNDEHLKGLVELKYLTVEEALAVSAKRHAGGIRK